MSDVAFALPVFVEQPRTGGEIYNRRLVDGLRRRGFEVEIVALKATADGPAKPRAFVARLREVCRRVPVVVYDTWLYRVLWPVVARLRVQRSARLISFSQLCYWDTYRSTPWRWSHRLRTWAALAPAHVNVGVSRAVLHDDLAPWMRFKKTEVVYPGCDDARVEVPQADCRRRPAQILSVGNYAPRKGFHVLIEAMSEIARRRPDLARDLTLRLVGNRAFSPPYVARLEGAVAQARLDGRVVLDDWQDRETVGRLLSESQLFASASESEGFGMVVMEAMLRGLPVVLGDFQTASELLGPVGNRGGAIVPRRAPSAFADAIVWHFDAEHPEAVGRRARQRAERIALTWDDVVEQFARTIRESSATVSWAVAS